MRYRILSPAGDYTFGQGAAEFLANTPETVAQAVKTRLELLRGEWFLDTTEGLDTALILGAGTQATYDQVVQERILGTEGVTTIDSYASYLADDRSLTIACFISTVYGPIIIQQVI